MKKLLKWLFRIVLTLVILVVLAAVILPFVIDPNDYKEEIEGKIFDKIGRVVHLNGDIGLKVFPWLALTFNDVKVENEKGFKDKNMMDIKQVSARVKIMPLISKKVEIGQVSLNEAKFNLQISKKGHSNWQSILHKLETKAEKEVQSNDKSPSTEINIEGVELNDIQVNYTDLKTNTRINVSNFNLKVGKINKKDPVEVASKMHVSMPDSGLDIDLIADIKAKNLLADAGIQVDLDTLSIVGKMNNNATPINVTLQKPGRIDLGKDTLSLPEIMLAIGEVEIITNLAAKDFSKVNSHLSGTYKIKPFDLNEFLKKMTGAYFVTNDTFSDFSSSGSWAMSGSHFNLSNLKINFAKTAINGKANISNIEKMIGNFDLKINQLTIDDFLGNEETAKSSSAQSSKPTNIDFGHLKGFIAIDKLLASGTTIEKLKITVKTDGPLLVLSPIKADFYQGVLVSAVKIDTSATTNKVILEHDMNKIHAGPLLTDLSGSKLLTGLGDFNVDLKVDRPFSDIPLKTAHGKIKYTLTDGAIYGVDVFGMMQKGLSMLYPDVKNEADDGEKKTSFALMQIDADINEGVLTTNVLKIESPYLQVLGDVKIDLVNMTIDGTIEPMLLNIPKQLTSDKYKKLLNLPIPVSLSGSLLEPKVGIDAKKLLLASQKERIDKEKNKLKDKLLGSLFGKDKDMDKNKDNEHNTDENQANDQKDKEPESDKDKLKKKLLKGILGDG